MTTAEPFTVRVDRAGDTLTLVLHGELDVLGARTLATGLADLDLSDVAVMAVDCSGLTFLDSSGISTLLELEGRARWASVDFALVHVNAPQRRAIEIADLLDHLRVEDISSPDGDATTGPPPVRSTVDDP